MVILITARNAELAHLRPGLVGLRSRKTFPSRSPEARREYYLSKTREYNRKYRERYDKEGLCAQCGKIPREEGFVTCAGCAERTKTNGKEYRLRLRLKAYEAYGGSKCVCCETEHLEFLTLDHIGGGGAEHRREVGAGDKLYRWLRNNDYPPGFRVLCFNCNYAVFRYGSCPHERTQD